jgi:hypothetical protein
MKPLISSLCAAAMALSVAIPANAGVLQAPSISPPSSIVKVQGTDYYGSGGRAEPGMRRHWRGDRSDWRGHRRDWRARDRHGGSYYWRGHRGSRYYRPGYRRHNDWWFPAAAFLGGAIIGNVIASQPRATYRRGVSSAHVDWCYSRYRSYRAYDNTFQPYNGPRRQCNSPYGP